MVVPSFDGCVAVGAVPGSSTGLAVALGGCEEDFGGCCWWGDFYFRAMPVASCTHWRERLSMVIAGEEWS